MVQQRRKQELSLINLAAIHSGGSAGNTILSNRMFGRRVAAFATQGNTYIHFIDYVAWLQIYLHS